MHRFSLILPVILFVSFSSCITDYSVEITELRTEMRENPDGVGTTTPRFSWKLVSDQDGVYQTAYRIKIATSLQDLKDEKNLCWDSGKTDSSESVLIPYNGDPLESGKEYFWEVSVRTNKGGPYHSCSGKWSMALLNDSEWQASWIGINDSVRLLEDFTRLPARYLRKEFRLSRRVKRAMLYISGLGSSVGYINGKRISDDVFGVPHSLYIKTIYYNTYNVTPFLAEGTNTMGVILGNGRFMTMDEPTLRGVAVPRLKAQLDIEHEDGTHEWIYTDTSWRATNNGPIIANNEYDGEEYDERLALGDWTTNGYNDSKWQKVDIMPDPGGKLTPVSAESIRVMEEVVPVCVKAVSDNKYILDMGQNMVGWLQMNVKGEKGHPITLRFAETLQPGDTAIFVENLREAKATDVYIPAKDGLFTWEPMFTYHGFRYVEISGLNHTPAGTDFTGKVIYDRMETIGTFETSNELINRIYTNACWSIKGNYRGIPTDCPQRDERQGWLGDRAGTLFSESFVFNNALFYNKWMDDIEDSMSDKGQISVVSPRSWTIYTDDAAWSSTYFYLADMLYTQYGDIRVIQEHYPSMKKWLEYMISHSLKDYLLINHSFGDWCMPPESPELIHSQDPARKTDGGILNTTIFYDILQMMWKFAVLNDFPEDARYYHKLMIQIKNAYNGKYFNYETAQYGNNTVTGNLLSLELGLVPEGYEERVFANIVEKIENENGGHISSGIVGLRHLMKGLTKHGRIDLAIKLATNETYPGWGYMVKQGATTIWELWNGDTADPAMNSANHVMLIGDLIRWLYEDLAGIKSDPHAPGFKRILMSPSFPEKPDHVKASYHSPYGLIKSEWQREGGQIKWEIAIPPNTTAVVQLPASFRIQITNEKGILNSTIGDNYQSFELGSGKYRISVINLPACFGGR